MTTVRLIHSDCLSRGVERTFKGEHSGEKQFTGNIMGRLDN